MNEAPESPAAPLPPWSKTAVASAIFPLTTMPLNVLLMVITGMTIEHVPLAARIWPLFFSFAIPGMIGLTLSLSALFILLRHRGAYRGFGLAVPCLIWSLSWIATALGLLLLTVWR